MADTSAAVHIELEKVRIKGVTLKGTKAIWLMEVNNEDMTATIDDITRIQQEGFEGVVVIEGLWEQTRIDFEKAAGTDGAAPATS